MKYILLDWTERGFCEKLFQKDGNSSYLTCLACLQILIFSADHSQVIHLDFFSDPSPNLFDSLGSPSYTYFVLGDHMIYSCVCYAPGL